MQVSLITCTFNSEKTIKNCCISILNQNYENIEHIVVDNNSIDSSIKIIESCKINNQKIIRQKSKGIYGALNEGINHSSGEIIGVLHSDDIYYNNEIISDVVKIFKEKDVDVLYSNLIYTKKYDTDKILRKWKNKMNEGIQSSENIEKYIKSGWMPPHPTIFLKKKLISKYDLKYEENLKISSDYDFIIKLFLNKFLKIYFLNMYSIKMRYGGASNKNLKNILIKMKEDYSILKKYKFNPIKIILLKNFSKIKQFLK